MSACEPCKSFSLPTNIKTCKNKLALNVGKVGCAIAVLSIAGIASATSSQVIAASAYVITDLGNPSSDSTDIRANAINNSGKVVGRDVRLIKPFMALSGIAERYRNYPNSVMLISLPDQSMTVAP